MLTAARVLIVDASEETRVVLQTMLTARGVSTLSARRAQEGLDLARRHRPECIVLDLDVESVPGRSRATTVAAQFAQALPPSETTVVALGTIRREEREGPTGFEGEFVAKPYHYGSLLRKIEAVLGERRTPMLEVPPSPTGR